MSVKNTSSSSPVLGPIALPSERQNREDQRIQRASSAVILKSPQSSLYLNQYDRLIGPMVREFTSWPNADRKLMVLQLSPGQRWHLTGAEIGSLLLQLRAVIPQIASIDPEKRADSPVTVVGLNGEQIQVQAGLIPGYLEKLQSFLHPGKENRLLLPPHDEYERKEEMFEEVTSRDVQAVLCSEKSARKALVDELSSWILDPGNPEKGKKYIYSLYSTRKALDEKFPGWKRKFLPVLREQASKSAFAKNAYFALNALKENAESEEEIRAQYAFILSNIREALSHIPSVRFDTDELKQTLQMILQFCHFKFTRVHMYPFLDDFICKSLQAPQAKSHYELPQFTLKAFADDIGKANDRLMTIAPAYRQTLIAKEFKKLRGVIGWGFDPNRDSNTPWVHSIQEAETEQGARVCTVLRHGTPTCDPGFVGTVTRFVQNAIRLTPWQQATVIAEYKAHLAAEPEKVTLYVNHQEFDGTGQHWVSAEIDRAKAIQLLEKDYANFNFLALPMDGPIWEKGCLEKPMSDLKRALFDSLMNQTHGFALPKTISQKPECAQRIAGLLDEVHKLYFNGEELATPDLKKAFIMLFYSELKDYLKNILKVDTIVSACKDHKERGNVSTTIDMMKNLVKLGVENDPALLREVFISVLAPFIIKNEHIIPTRLGVCLTVIRVLANLTDAQKERIREKSITGYQIKRQTVPKEEISWAQMVGSRQFFASVENMRNLKEQRVMIDHQFQANLASTYLVNEKWNLIALKQQIERDMPCCEIRLNGNRMLEFGAVCKELDLNPDLFKQNVPNASLKKEQREAIFFLATLHQGAAAESMRDASHYLNGNAAGLVVAQGVLDPMRLNIHSLIALARTNKAAALESAIKYSEENPDFASYLRSAVVFGFLPQEFMPKVGLEQPLKVIYPTRIYGKFVPQDGSRELIIEQELELREPEGRGKKYPILAKISMQDARFARISWHFIP